MKLPAWLLVLGCPLFAQKAPENLLKNGDFESGGTHDAAHWAEIWPRGVLKTPPKFDRSKKDAHGGKACVVLTVPEAGGYCSFTQEIATPPKDARSVRVEGWIDFTPDPKVEGTPSIMILLTDPSKPDERSTIKQQRLPAGAKGWTKVAFDAPVAQGETKWLLRCGMTGCGAARFDDVVLTAGTEMTEVVSLIEAHGEYFLIEKGTGDEPWIEFSLPFPFEGQTPVAVKIATTPPERFVRAEIVVEDENRHVRVHLKQAGKDVRCDVRLDALVMVRDRQLGNGAGVQLSPRAKLPPHVARYFEKTPGIDADDADIAAVAKKVKADTVANAVEGVLAWLRENFKYEGGGDQGAKASFGRKNAVCTGHANLAAALFQAAGVPCRVLGCLMGDRLQEHYIVEVWAPYEGWRRVESTTKMFPIADSMHLILHVAHPKFHRSGGNVPLHVQGARGCIVNFDTRKDQCWQGMSQPEPVAVTPSDAALLEKAARDGFVTWESTPSDLATVTLVDSAPKGASKRASAVLDKITAFLKAKKP